MVRGAPAAVTQLARGGARSVRHLRLGALHQQVRQRHRGAQEQGRKAGFASRGDHQRGQGAEQGGGDDR